MTTTTVAIEQHEGALSPDGRPLAALAVRATDLPSFLEWQVDEDEGSRFAIVGLGDWEFALETDDEEPHQTTVYGVEAGEALDQLIDALGLDDEVVLDRVDQAHAGDAALVGAAETAEAIRAAAEDVIQMYAARLSVMEARIAHDSEQRRLMAVLELGGGTLTARKREALALLGSGASEDEAAEEMGISRETLVRYRREALSRYFSSHLASSSPAVAEADVPTLKARILDMRQRGMTLQAIADTLNSEGVPTLRGSSAWRPSSVQGAVGYRRPKRARTTQHVRKNVSSD
jgi:hypothetical protein